MWESIMYLLIANNDRSNTLLKENKYIKNKEKY